MGLLTCGFKLFSSAIPQVEKLKKKIQSPLYPWDNWQKPVKNYARGVHPQSKPHNIPTGKFPLKTSEDQAYN